MINLIKLPAGSMEQVLDEAGYGEHHKGDGWVYCLVRRERFHAHCTLVGIMIHIDKQVRGKHVVIKDKVRLREEKKRLVEIARRMGVLHQPILRVETEKVKKAKANKIKNVLASNLAEIQKNIKQDMKQYQKKCHNCNKPMLTVNNENIWEYCSEECLRKHANRLLKEEKKLSTVKR